MQANSTFQFIDSIGDYAREWLSISQELRDFLHKPKTERNLQAIREVRAGFLSVSAPLL